MSERLLWTLEEIRDARATMLPDAVSLNERLRPESGTPELGDLVREKSAEVPEDVAHRMETAQLLEAMNRLTERNRYVLARPYGVYGWPRTSATELSRELGMSPKRVFKLKNEAERNLKGELRGRLVRQAAV